MCLRETFLGADIRLSPAYRRHAGHPPNNVKVLPDTLAVQLSWLVKKLLPTFCRVGRWTIETVQFQTALVPPKPRRGPEGLRPDLSYRS